VASGIDALVTAVLTHPTVIAVKRPIKDAVWQVRGMGVRNPTLPSKPRSWLFVCKGNICRSPFAALLGTRLLAEFGLDNTACLSAGLDVTQSDRSPARAVESAAAYDIALSDHRPAAITAAMIERSDVVVVMEVGQLAQLRRQYPQYADRVVLLSLYAPDAETGGAYRRLHITDPFGKSKGAFDDCYARIEAAMRAMFSLAVRPPAPGTAH
jgi:protein-tyrosine phosphatase